MAHLNRSGGVDDGVPPTNKSLLVVAGILLAIPIVALLWVSSYARETPRLWGFPFFFWYQFLWVFICAGLHVRRAPARAAARTGPYDGPATVRTSDDPAR